MFLTGNHGSEIIRATGTIEIDTVHVSAEVGGTISLLAFKESEEVTAGDLMARINRPDLQFQMERDTAGAAKANALLADIKKGARSEEIAQARASRDAALAAYDQTARDTVRYTALYSEGIISKKEMEQTTLSEELAENNLKRASETLAILEAGPRPDQLDAQKEATRQAEAVLSMTRSLLDKTEIRSPATGTVLTRNFEPGELAAPGSILYSIGRYTDCYVRIYIPSTMLGRISPGQAAEVRVDSFPDTLFSGTVFEIAEKAEFAPRQSITPDERANMVFRVKISVENTKGLLKPGMPADVTLR